MGRLKSKFGKEILNFRINNQTFRQFNKYLKDLPLPLTFESANKMAKQGKISILSWLEQIHKIIPNARGNYFAAVAS